jgi:hypothetical protein
MKPKLHTLICSTRRGRVGPSVAQWFHDIACDHRKFDAGLVDRTEFNLPVYGRLFPLPARACCRSRDHRWRKWWQPAQFRRLSISCAIACERPRPLHLQPRRYRACIHGIHGCGDRLGAFLDNRLSEQCRRRLCSPVRLEGPLGKAISGAEPGPPLPAGPETYTRVRNPASRPGSHQASRQNCGRAAVARGCPPRVRLWRPR